MSFYLAAWYLAVSTICFVTYGFDKSAARAGRRRVSEGRLHFVSIIGGWPGAILAQQVFRHKSRKREFQIVFWITVSLNLGACVIWFSPFLKEVRLWM